MGNGLCSRPAYFNPRSPRGGATRSLKRGITSSVNFNPRSPRGGATVTKPVFDDNDVISIHAPHEGERPLQRTGEMMQVIISIHAPHEGERLCFPDNWSRAKINFNPRSPRGGATIHCLFSFVFWYIFQSTLPTRGSDKPRRLNGVEKKYFNPRSPRGGATIRTGQNTPRLLPFQSTLPTRGSDQQ